MKVRDLHPRDPVTVTPYDTLRSASKHLSDDDIGALVIVGSHGAQAIISERDINRAVADGVDLDSTPVDDYMTESPVFVDIEAPIGEAIAKMNEYDFRHLVVTEGEDVVGIISMRDVFHLLGSAWPEL